VPDFVATALPAELRERIRVVLVEPSHPGNIGAAARAMKTMGLARLTLVAPRRFPDPEAVLRATGAADVLAAAEVVASLAQAVGDCTLVIGTSARSRSVPWPLVDAREAGRRVLEEAGRGTAALVFGRESAGLTNDELMRCHLHLHVPTDPAHPSLNLAMAVQLVAYEVRMAWLEQADTPPPQRWDRPWARASDVEGFLAHLDSVLEEVGFYDDREPPHVMRRMRRLFFRTRMDQVEVNILRGMLSAMQRRMGGVGAGSRRRRPGRGGQKTAAERGQGTENKGRADRETD